MAALDPTLLILLALAALGILSHNMTVTLAILILIAIRITPLNSFFPWVEKYGLTIGVLILTIGVMAPIASGKISASEVLHSFVQWKSILAIVVGGGGIVARRARCLIDDAPTVGGGGATGRNGARRRLVQRRPCRAIDCRRFALTGHRQVVR